jgi:hypothetical protein
LEIDQQQQQNDNNNSNNNIKYANGNGEMGKAHIYATDYVIKLFASLIVITRDANQTVH